MSTLGEPTLSFNGTVVDRECQLKDILLEIKEDDLEDLTEKSIALLSLHSSQLMSNLESANSNASKVLIQKAPLCKFCEGQA